MTYAMLWFNSLEFDFHFLCFTFIVRNCAHQVDTTKKKNKETKMKTKPNISLNCSTGNKCFIRKLFTL